MRRVARWGLGVVILLAVSGAWFLWVVNPVVFNYAKTALDAYTLRAVNAGVSEVVTADSYAALTDVRRDAAGVITSISADARAMNLLAAQVATRAEAHLGELGEQGIPVPVGTFSGIPLLVGRGLPVMLKLQLVGAVNCRFDSIFATAGINQTQHKITLGVDATVDVILPLGTRRTQISVQMLFAESIIVGQVPEFFLQK